MRVAPVIRLTGLIGVMHASANPAILVVPAIPRSLAIHSIPSNPLMHTTGPLAAGLLRVQ
jgi:hypothetical protein